jgi:hypothetical protein
MHPEIPPPHPLHFTSSIENHFFRLCQHSKSRIRELPSIFVIRHVIEDCLDDAELLIHKLNSAYLTRILPMNSDDFNLHEAALFAELTDIIEFKRFVFERQTLNDRKMLQFIGIVPN